MNIQTRKCFRVQSETKYNHLHTFWDYSELKKYMVHQTQKFGFFTSIYSFVAISPKCSIFTCLGLLGSLGYLHLLISDIESVTALDSTPMLRALETESPSRRYSQMLSHAYSTALKPRLLIPIFLALSCMVFNNIIKYPDYHIGASEEIFLIAGFLSFKYPLILILVKELNSERPNL